MSQKSSVPQAVSFVSQVLKRDRGQGLDRFRDEREAVREVVALTRDQAHAAPAPVRKDPKAVVLDLVNPPRARRRLIRPNAAGTD